MTITSAVVAWTVLGVALAALEISAPIFVFASLALAALGAALAASLGASFEAQLVVFTVVAVAVLAVAWRRGRRWLAAQSPVATNADALRGERARVATAIDNARDEGQVLLQGMEWTARSAHGVPIPVDTRVRVVRVDGVKLIVEPDPATTPGSGESRE